MEKPDGKSAIQPPVLALDLGQKRVGVAVSDALSISINRLEGLRRTSWKRLLQDVDELVRRFDAKTLVIGLPLRLNGSSGDSAVEARRTAEKFAHSLKIPVYLQDERLTSREAAENLRTEGYDRKHLAALVDSESATLILRDFLRSDQERLPVSIR